MEDKPYNSNCYNFDSQSLSSRGNFSNSNSGNSRNHNSIMQPTSANQLSFDCRRSRSKFASQTNPLIYTKLFKQVQLYETNKKRISQRFHQYKHLFPSLKDQQIIELVKDQFKEEKQKFEYSGKDPKKQYQDIIKKHCITKQIEQQIVRGYIKYEGDLQRICYQLHSKSAIYSQKNTITTSTAQFILPRQLQLILIVRIKASICKLQQLVKQKRLVKIFIAFNQLQLNQIAYRFLEVHKGKVYSMDKALPIVSFSVIFSGEFIEGRIQINQKEALNLYKFMVNVLSAVQSETFFKKEKFDINQINNNNIIQKNVLKQSPVFKQHLQTTKSPLIKSHLNNESKQHNKQTFDEWYSSVVRFYLQCGDWKKVLPKLLSLYGTQFKYFKWSVLQRKVESFLRVVYQLFLSKLTEQNNLLQYKKQLPLQSRIKFIHITTWKVHQPLLFMLFYFYINGNELLPYHLKEIINYLTNNKDMLCSTKKQMPDSVRRDLLKIEQEHTQSIIQENAEPIIEENGKNYQKESNFMFEQESQQMVLSDNEKNQKQYHKKEQKIQLKQAKNDKCNFKQIKEDDGLLFSRPSYTLEEKLKQYKQMWKQQAFKNIKMKEQIKKQPNLWRKLQKFSQLSGSHVEGLNSQQLLKHEDYSFMAHQGQQRQREYRYEHKKYNNDQDQGCFFHSKYSIPINTSQLQYKRNTHKGFNDYHYEQIKNYGPYLKQRQQSVSFNHYHQHHQQQHDNHTNLNYNPSPNFDGYKRRSRKQFLQQVIRDKLKQKLNHQTTTTKKGYSLLNETTRTDRFSIHLAYSETIWCQRFSNFKYVHHEGKSPQQQQQCHQLYGQYEQQQFQQQSQLMNQLEQGYQENISINPQQLLQKQQQQQQLSLIDSYEYLLQQDQQHMLELNHHHQQHIIIHSDNM